jgi:predicted amidohydrolase
MRRRGLTVDNFESQGIARRRLSAPAVNESPRPRTLGAAFLGLLLISALVTSCASDSSRTPVNAGKTDLEVHSRAAIIHFRPQLLDLDRNVSDLSALASQAFKHGANFVVIPEQATTGFSITRSNAENGMALSAPFAKLSALKKLAVANHGFLTLGIAERSSDGRFFNSAVTFGPSGDVHVQRKRLAAENAAFGWNSRGDNPFEVIPTRFGDIGIVICADTFLMDWPRIETLKGADILLVPANWWGENDQMSLWQVRAKQNGVWLIVANRWGAEPNLFPPPNDYYMDDSPSAVFDPDGKSKVFYREDEDKVHKNRIFYYDIHVPKGRIGEGAQNTTPTVQNRRVSAYGALRNIYYTPASHNQAPPGLPAAGITRVQLLTYTPDVSADINLKTLQAQVPKGSADVLLMPGLGFTAKAVDLGKTPEWFNGVEWKQLSSFAAEREIELLVTSVVLFENGHKCEALVAFQRGAKPLLAKQIHDSGSLKGSGAPPAVLDVAHARVAVLTGLDSLFPETSTAVAKSGADICLICSTVLGRGTSVLENTGLEGDIPNGWTFENFHNNCKVMAKNCVHVAAVDSAGLSVAITSGGYSMVSEDASIASYTYPVVPFDSSNTRVKLLNYYYPFDIDSLVPTVPNSP